VICEAFGEFHSSFATQGMAAATIAALTTQNSTQKN
jgi:hypothetical protein